ncbi:hypothetical protein FRB99_006317 [Tulasnella sp. 403]|nr:hypothetical protein FRB99_006317 [Tulasnella sp. 403]
MSTHSAQRYFPNELDPIQTDKEILKQVVSKLREGVLLALELIEQESRKSRKGNKDGIYIGESGIALMYMRLAAQAKALALPTELKASFPSRILSHIPESISTTHNPEAGYLSPLDTKLGPALLVILYELRFPGTYHDIIWTRAVTMLKTAVNVAATDGRSGGDEVLYGRAGLLWGMLNLKECLDESLGDEKKRKELGKIVNEDTVGYVVDVIIEVGKFCAKEYKKAHSDGVPPPPLVWPWHDSYYLGAIHGAAGIMTVLLQCPQKTIERYLPLIESTTEYLVSLTSHTGHLPSSIPPKHRSDPYVQICHGSPGLLLLLNTFRQTYPDRFKEEWETIETKASRAVWEEGLVTKGLGICHGVTGNAWSWLLSAYQEVITSSITGPDDFSPTLQTNLSRGLAYMVHATELPPILQNPLLPYRTPDRPYSLFEGLAGAVCAWAEACCVIEACLKGEEVTPVLGFPGLGGVGPTGLL